VRADGTIVFQVEYSSHGSKSKMLDILKALRSEDVDVGEDVLQRAFRVFEKQSEVDYFINKDAEKFLKEQFDLWMYQYLFDGENVWLQRRIEQLQALKRIAFSVIDFIAQFEDELVRVWNKPKFVRDSHYVITLDRIAERNAKLLTRLLAHEGMAAQVAEWRELGMVGQDFAPGDVWERDLSEERLDDAYQYLPIDTRHVPELEMDIVGLFEHLDEALDGWLIKSENYQALNTLQPRFREQVKCIYIDPPYNTGNDEFIYRDYYKHSSWLSLMENRLHLGRSWLQRNAAIFISCDDNEDHRLKALCSRIFSEVK
jgi:adenine specific DNA methylase Mod